MTPLDHHLKDALRREQPADGFAERVLARLDQPRPIKSPSRDSVLTFFTQPFMRWATAVALVIAMVAGGVRYRNVQRERAEGEAAKHRLMLALRIAGSKLQLAKSKVNQTHTDPTENHEEKE
jgi:hypothetical protein